jgi:hypothetical protein
MPAGALSDFFGPGRTVGIPLRPAHLLSEKSRVIPPVQCRTLPAYGVPCAARIGQAQVPMLHVANTIAGASAEPKELLLSLSPFDRLV